jgi:asparagine synthase (glutamine-hydrolysing)
VTGIVVVFDPLGREESIRQLLPKMCAALQGTDQSGEIEWYVGPGIGIGRHRSGVINREPQPAWSKDGTICAFFHGELFGCRDLIRASEREAQRNTRDSYGELVIRLYQSRGDAFVQTLNGGFALALWDSRQRKLVIATDRHNLRPLYSAQSGGLYLWASAPKAILSSSAFARRVNVAALADFMCIGIPQGSDTMFEGIHEVPPATLTVCQRKQVRSQQYWDFLLQEEETGIPVDDYLDECVHLLRQAVERRQEGNLSVGFLLSGGLDSRVIASALDPGAIQAFTYGTRFCEDIRFARKVAKAGKFVHHVLAVEPDYLATYAQLGIERTPDLICCDQFHSIGVYDWIASQVNALITGSVAEDVFGHMARDPESEFWARSFSVDGYYDSYSIMGDGEVARLFQPAYAGQIRGLARARFRRDFDKYRSRHITHRVDYWSVMQQQRRLYNRLSYLFPADLAFRPVFLDNDLVDFARSIPHSMRWGDGSLYKRIVLSRAPKLAGIPLTTTNGMPLHVNCCQIARRERLRKNWRRLQHRLIRATRGLLPLSQRTGFYADYDRWLRRELKGWAASILLDPRTLSREYWRVSEIVRLMEDHSRGKRRKGARKIMSIISFELWHRAYMDRTDAS